MHNKAKGQHIRTLNVPAGAGIHIINGDIYMTGYLDEGIFVLDRTTGETIRTLGTGMGDGLHGITWEPVEQTEFFAYTSGGRVSLGTPDGGVSVPALSALCPAPTGVGALVCPNHITDIRTAIENLAPYFVNAITGNLFNFTDESADNLYYVAMGDRTKYGATGGARYAWTRTLEQMKGTPTYDIDIGEVRECINVLQASDIR